MTDNGFSHAVPSVARNLFGECLLSERQDTSEPGFRHRSVPIRHGGFLVPALLGMTNWSRQAVNTLRGDNLTSRALPFSVLHPEPGVPGIDQRVLMKSP